MQDVDNKGTYLGLSNNQIYSLFEDNTVIEFSGGTLGVHNLDLKHLDKNVDSICFTIVDGRVTLTLYSFRNVSIYEFQYIEKFGIPDKISFTNETPPIEGQSNVAKFIAEDMEGKKDNVFGFLWNKSDYQITMQRLSGNQSSIYYRLTQPD